MSATTIKKINYTRAKRIARDAYCHCGKLRIPTPSGGTCPEHKIVSGLTEDDIQLAPYIKKLLSLRETAPANRFSTAKNCRRWVVGGQVCTRAVKREPVLHGVVVDGDSIYECGFVPLKKQPEK